MLRELSVDALAKQAWNPVKAIRDAGLQSKGIPEGPMSLPWND